MSRLLFLLPVVALAVPAGCNGWACSCDCTYPGGTTQFIGTDCTQEAASSGVTSACTAIQGTPGPVSCQPVFIPTIVGCDP